MATPNKFLEQPARGTLVGVWDTPVNNNMGIIDNSFGGVAFIALTNSPVILSSAQYQNQFIVFTGALSGNCAISFPNVGSFYTIMNLTTNSSAFQVTLQSTVAGSYQIGAPTGEACFQICNLNVAGNIRFVNLPPVGSFMDYVGSSVPAWVSNCTLPPYLNCDGTSFSSVSYPALATVLGGTTLPDLRGVTRATLNQATGRITSGSSTGGIDGNTNLSIGGSQITTLSSQNIPPVPYVDPAHSHSPYSGAIAVGGGPTFINALGSSVTGSSQFNTTTSLTGITIGSTSPTNFSNMPPTTIAGITMVRAG